MFINIGKVDKSTKLKSNTKLKKMQLLRLLCNDFESVIFWKKIDVNLYTIHNLF